jgi:hypothetical protein
LLTSVTAPLAGLTLGYASSMGAPPASLSGIHPHLAMFNDENECGTGAVVSWEGRLWVITYGPHLPYGSSDKLYEISPGLRRVVRPESVGGTHANRMIHRETGQLILGPYFIGQGGRVRVISPRAMPGRLTGTARHLEEPGSKVYFATMEEGLYEVDARSLEVTGLIRDGNAAPPGRTEEKRPATLDSKLPGYHGKGLYSGQGRLIYANNGEHGAAALLDPGVASGALAEWRGPGEDWRMARRNQFTDVTGPGGIYGNSRPERDPVWSIGWDARSVILMCLDGGRWHTYRLPKGSHSYDGAHGWNTEWPRIRDIGEPSLLMTMHGLFWRFPRGFDSRHSGGIRPRSAYLKVIGDFCRWNDQVVFGCDDAAKSEFLNRRKAKGTMAGPGRSQSNLWFVEPPRLDQLGPALARGAVWLREAVQAGVPSDPFLFAGFDLRGVHVTHSATGAMSFGIEVDVRGNGTWRKLRSITIPASGYAWTEFGETDRGEWVRLVPAGDCPRVTALFAYRNRDKRESPAGKLFDGLAEPGEVEVSAGVLHARSGGRETLRFVAANGGGELGGYDLDGELKLRPSRDPEGDEWTRKNVAIPEGVLETDGASVLYVDERGRWRLPHGDELLNQPGRMGGDRVSREVCTERDLFNAGGTFYELPAENAGGFARIRPVATHNRRIKDYASYRGLLVLSGVRDRARGRHILRSTDGKCALWGGAVDDLWAMGKPRGRGGPWKETAVRAGVASDPYLMTGFDRKQLELRHDAWEPVTFTVEVDFTGQGDWAAYESLEVAPFRPRSLVFPEAFDAYWVRLVPNRDVTATATFSYQ